MVNYRKRSTSIGCAFNEEDIERMLMARFKKKPVEIEATKVVPWSDSPEQFKEIANWCNGKVTTLSGGEMSIVIETLEGDMTAMAGDWIIKGVENEFYPCKDSIFKATYEQIDW